ncbi:hypothetical protein ACFYO2_36500 [Streptomyces sp. NPDC006602]
MPGPYTFDCEILVATAWTQRLIVADRFGQGRFLAGRRCAAQRVAHRDAV